MVLKRSYQVVYAFNLVTTVATSAKPETADTVVEATLYTTEKHVTVLSVLSPQKHLIHSTFPRGILPQLRRSGNTAVTQ